MGCARDLSARLKPNPTMCAHVCVSGSDSAAALSAMTRRRQGMPRSCSFHLMRQTPAQIQQHLPWLNLNLPGCSMSNSLRTTAIRQATSNCFSAVTTPVQRFSQSSSKRSAVHPRHRAHPLWGSLLSTAVHKLARVDMSLQILIRGCLSFLLRLLENRKLAHEGVRHEAWRPRDEIPS